MTLGSLTITPGSNFVSVSGSTWIAQSNTNTTSTNSSLTSFNTTSFSWNHTNNSGGSRSSITGLPTTTATDMTIT